MFTGIVQTMGTIRSIQQQPAGARLVVDAPRLRRPLADGASVSVNGACLTVTGSDPSRIEFDVVPETLTRTTLGKLSTGDKVNLEPSLRAGDPMDGHMVQGHVDGLARVLRREAQKQGEIWTFTTDTELMAYVIPKGSIAVDGVSLTIAAIEDNSFSIALIPTTLRETTLGALRPGDAVNIETDITARTIITTLRRMQADHPPSKLTLEGLRENGW